MNNDFDQPVPGHDAASSVQAGLNFDDPRIADAVQQYLAALEAGHHPSRQEFLARCPDIASELGQCLDGLEFVHDAAAELRAGSAASWRPNDERSLPLGDFRLIREIGRGGMGVVYEAEQLSLGRRVAVKVLPFAAGFDALHLQRFKNEAQAAAQLHHTNIVPVYAVGIDRGVHFYAMQLIDGQPLSTLIRQLRHKAGKPDVDDPTQAMSTGGELRPSPASGSRGAEPTIAFPEPHSVPSQPADPISSTLIAAEDATRSDHFRAVAGLVRQAASAIEHAHQFGIVHRDIKPANLLVDHRGNIWVTDFGLAMIQADMTLTRTGDLLGTLRYMSPEQAAGDRGVLNHRTDIYSLGVTLYELLTLEPVFANSSRHDLLQRIIADDPTPPRTLNPAIPLDLETIVLKATAKTAADRYARAQDFADDLQRFLDDRPILARRPRLIDLAQKWARRHQSIVQAASAFLGLLFLGLVAATILVVREHRATATAYQREIQEHEAAEKSFLQARQAVDAFTQLGEEELAGKPGMYDLRRKFLETSLEYYNSFLDQRRDDPAAATELEAARRRVAQIIDDLSVLEGYAPLMLLDNPDVQNDLAITQDRWTRIEPLLAGLDLDRKWSEVKDQFDPRQRQQQLADALRAQQRKITSLLSPHELERLRQITWQQRGPFAFKSPEVVAALKLTSEQRQRVNQIIEEERPDKRPHGPDGHRPDGPDGHGPDGRGPGGHGPASNGPPPNFDHFLSEDDARGPPPRPRSSDHPGGPRFDHHGPGPDGPDGRHGPDGGNPMRQTMERTTARIVAMLSSEQQSIWTRLIGKPVAYDLHWSPDRWLPQ
jgi:hypothetical protein